MSDKRVALITGAASGIGAAAARRFAADGAGALVLVDRDPGALNAFAATIDGPQKLVIARDVTDDLGWRETENDIRERFGGVDIAVANAGVSDAGTLADLSFEAWRRVLSVNLDGVFLTLRCAMRLMEDRGGAIVVVSSASAVKAEIGVGAYGASKAGAAQLTRVAAKEGAAAGIRVNAILPGGVETPIWSTMPFFQDLVHEHGSQRAAFDAMAKMATPLARYATADEVAGHIAFACSPAAATMTGALLVVDGGYTL